mmetsp:Transcript_7086/g.12959  ORF Transcript_7086/g.12959 Transcript_7086/m.12959 type:complete len:468 (-) Transcript_7086:31-1434(-)
MAQTLADLKHVLHKSKNPKGYDLQSHLGELLNYFAIEKPAGAVDRFEELSAFVQQYSFYYKEPLSEEEIKKIARRKTELTDWVKKSWRLLRQVKSAEGHAVIGKHKPLPHLPNLVKDAEMLRQAGVDFGEDETYRLHLSLKRLLETSGAAELRFWGKILTREKDYYVAEGQLPFIVHEDIARPRDFEPRGTGVNSLTYWVSDSAFQEWTELPDVTPDQLRVSRLIKKILTGRLDAEVKSYPPFPGKERHLLRAQIARITHANVLMPKGLLRTNEEDTNKIEYEEEFAMPGTEDMLSPESWVHLHAAILQAGRLVHMLPEVPPGSEEDPEELKAKLEADDPPVDRLRAANEDDPYVGTEMSSWLSKMVGHNQVYAAKPPGEGSQNYGVGVLTSLRWPGAITAFKGGRWANLYVGYGLKSGVTAFNPVFPPDVFNDPDDPSEEHEPNPAERPVVLEQDSDADNQSEDED